MMIRKRYKNSHKICIQCILKFVCIINMYFYTLSKSSIIYRLGIKGDIVNIWYNPLFPCNRQTGKKRGKRLSMSTLVASWQPYLFGANWYWHKWKKLNTKQLFFVNDKVSSKKVAWLANLSCVFLELGLFYWLDAEL